MSQATVLAKIATAIAEVQAMTTLPPAPVPTGAVALGLVFGASGYLPWACAQVFKRGDLPAGAGVIADCPEFQCVPWSYHDDGSVRAAHVAGYCQVAAAGMVTVTMRAGSATTGQFTPAAPVDLQVSVDGVSPPITRTTVIAFGPVMLHEQVRRRVDAQVSVVYEQRRFRKGEVEILAPCIENTGMVATPQPNRVLALAVTAGGVTRFAETVDVKHHTRIPLVRGRGWTYWLGVDPLVRPDHDHAYLCACESFPPYAPVPAVLPAVPTSYSPNSCGEGGNYMPGTGYSPRIGLLGRSNVYALTTGGQTAWDYMMAQAFTSGSWSIHLRDETTDEAPRFGRWPTHTWQTNIPRGSGGENGAADIAHQPSLVYAAGMLTGWRWFADEHLAWCSYNHFYQHVAIRQGASGLLRTDVGTNQDRGAAWALRTLAQAIALVPNLHANWLDLVASWQANMTYYEGRYVLGTIDAGRYVNNIGVIAPYSSIGTSLYTGVDRGNSTAWWGAGWMQSLLTQALGHALQLALPIGSANAATASVFQQSAKLIVGLCGLEWNWRRFGVYAMPFGRNGSGAVSSAWYGTFAEMYAEYIAAKGLQSLDPANGGTIKQHSTEKDIGAQDWMTGFVSYPWPALVYAVLHGAPGAAAAFARVRSSASFPLLAAAVNEPEWCGMMPPGFKHPGAV